MTFKIKFDEFQMELMMNDQSLRVDNDTINEMEVYAVEDGLKEEKTLEIISESSINDKNKVKKELESFKFNWKNVSESTIEKLEAKESLTSSEWTQFVGEVVRQLRVIANQVELSMIASVSLNIANKYPDTFFYKIKRNGVEHQISKRPEKLIESIRNRLNYINRDSGPKPKKIKLTVDNVGHKITDLNDDDSTDKALLSSISVETELQNREEIKGLMLKTFQSQSVFMSQDPTVDEVKEKWKFLLVDPYIFQHILTKTSVDWVDFLNNFREMNSQVIEWARKSRKKAIRDMADSDIYINNEQKAMNIVSIWFGEPTNSYMNCYKVC